MGKDKDPIADAFGATTYERMGFAKRRPQRRRVTLGCVVNEADDATRAWASWSPQKPFMLERVCATVMGHNWDDLPERAREMLAPVGVLGFGLICPIELKDFMGTHTVWCDDEEGKSGPVEVPGVDMGLVSPAVYPVGSSNDVRLTHSLEWAVVFALTGVM